MSSLVLDLTDRGLHVEPDDLQRAGLDLEGKVEIVPLPSKRKITGLALTYVITRLGYALGVSDPVWTDEGWSLEVIGADQETILGQIFLTARGDLIAERSATLETITEAATRAKSAKAKAAA